MENLSRKININPEFDDSIFITPEEIKSEVESLAPKQRTTTAKELLSRKVQVLPTLIPPIFPRVGIGCLAGSSDTGKSAFLRQLSLQIVNHESDFLGWKITPEHFRTLYISSEDDAEAMSFLLNLQDKAKKFNPDYVDNLHFIFELENVFENIELQLQENKFDLIVIDCLTDLYGSKGSLNESTHVRSFLNPFKALADKYQCLIIFLHHLGKRSDDYEPNKRNLLGSQAIEAKMRFVLELRADPYDPTKRHLCCLKGNYLAREYKGESFELIFDDNMIFTATGHRTPFEDLQKLRSERSGVPMEQRVEQVKVLSSQGKSQRDIAKELQIGLATVNRYLNGSSERSVPPNP